MIIEHFWGQWPAFAFLSLPFILCAWLAGQVQANGWNPIRKALGFSTIIALFHSLPWKHVLMPDGWEKMATMEGWTEFVTTPVPAIIFFGAVATIAFKKAEALRMQSQYPWLYRRTGPLSWGPVKDS